MPSKKMDDDGDRKSQKQKLVPIQDHIFRLESEGIRFDLHGKRDAEHYLSTKCNFGLIPDAGIG